MEAAGVEEFRSKMDINVTEKHQDVASLPSMCTNIETPTSGKLLIHWDQGVIGETLLSAEMHV